MASINLTPLFRESVQTASGTFDNKPAVRLGKRAFRDTRRSSGIGCSLLPAYGKNQAADARLAGVEQRFTR